MAIIATINGLSEHQEKRDPAKRITRSHLPVVPEKLICPQSTYTQTKYQYVEHLLTKAKPRQRKDTKGLYATYSLEETLIMQLGEKLDSFFPFWETEIAISYTGQARRLY